eukprot:scaffold463_cov242-Pinguiococcus_pyrenoidosus.AAC.3
MSATQELTVLYGSQTGNAQQIAENLVADAEKKGIPASVYPMNEFKVRCAALPRPLKSLSRLATSIQRHFQGIRTPKTGFGGVGTFSDLIKASPAA